MQCEIGFESGRVWESDPGLNVESEAAIPTDRVKRVCGRLRE